MVIKNAIVICGVNDIKLKFFRERERDRESKFFVERNCILEEFILDRRRFLNLLSYGQRAGGEVCLLEFLKVDFLVC